jgi:hypothetical protein
MIAHSFMSLKLIACGHAPGSKQSREGNLRKRILGLKQAA